MKYRLTLEFDSKEDRKKIQEYLELRGLVFNNENMKFKITGDQNDKTNN